MWIVDNLRRTEGVSDKASRCLDVPVGDNDFPTGFDVLEVDNMGGPNTPFDNVHVDFVLTKGRQSIDQVDEGYDFGLVLDRAFVASGPDQRAGIEKSFPKVFFLTAGHAPKVRWNVFIGIALH